MSRLSEEEVGATGINWRYTAKPSDIPQIILKFVERISKNRANICGD